MVSGALVILFTFLTGNKKKIRKRWKDIVRTLPAEPSVSRALQKHVSKMSASLSPMTSKEQQIQSFTAGYMSISTPWVFFW